MAENLQLDQINQNLLKLIELQTTNNKQQAASTPFAGAEIMNSVASENREDFLQLVFDFIGVNQIPALGTVQVSRLVSQDGDFDWVQITGRTVSVAPPGTGFAQTNMQMRIRDGGSDRYIQEGGNWIHWENFIGAGPAAAVPGVFLSTANAPFTLPGRRRFKVGSQVTIEIQNLAGFVTTAQVVLHGIKVFATA